MFILKLKSLKVYNILDNALSSYDSEDSLSDGELYTKGYYLEDTPYESGASDQSQSAGTTAARGHSHGWSRGDYGGGGGYGHGGGGGDGGGLTDPFTILGGLAFLT